MTHTACIRLFSTFKPMPAFGTDITSCSLPLGDHLLRMHNSPMQSIQPCYDDQPIILYHDVLNSPRSSSSTNHSAELPRSSSSTRRFSQTGRHAVGRSYAALLHEPGQHPEIKSLSAQTIPSDTTSLTAILHAERKQSPTGKSYAPTVPC
jgi:hypothetical protein